MVCAALRIAIANLCQCSRICSFFFSYLFPQIVYSIRYLLNTKQWYERNKKKKKLLVIILSGWLWISHRAFECLNEYIMFWMRAHCFHGELMKLNAVAYVRCPRMWPVAVARPATGHADAMKKMYESMSHSQFDIINTRFMHTCKLCYR